MHLSSFHLTEIHRSSFDSVYAFCWQSSITGKSSVSNADLKQLYIVGGQQEMYWFLSEESHCEERQLLNYLCSTQTDYSVVTGADLQNYHLCPLYKRQTNIVLLEPVWYSEQASNMGWGHLSSNPNLAMGSWLYLS